MTYKKTLYSFLILVTVATVSLIYIRLVPEKKTFSCANTISCTKDLSGSLNPSKKRGEFMGKVIQTPTNGEETAQPTQVLGATTKKDKKILINLSTQKLYAYTQDSLTHTFTISSGKWNPTPIGKFYIWIKLRATDMEGGEKSLNTYYNLPNVPYTMYFYNESLGKWLGYGIHGAYWQTDFGKPASQGCITLSVKNAAELFEWADPPTRGNQTTASAKNLGTEVIIFGKAPI